MMRYLEVYAKVLVVDKDLLETAKRNDSAA